MTTKYYEFTGETLDWCGVTLNRIRAIKDFGDVKKGDLGGFIQCFENLSGNAWVYDNAKVSGNAQVYENAEVYENAKIFGNAEVYGNAQVYGNAKVAGNAQVYGDVHVSGRALVYGNAKVYRDAKVYGNAYVSGNAEVTTKTTTTPLTLSGLTYSVTITDEHMKIGCECHTFKEWAEFSDKRIFSMDKEKALEFCKSYKDYILGIAEQKKLS